ncbi:MAG: hypothetical protein RPS47_16145 [Colwellia sp.]|jgi:hypothetical protein
MAVFTGGTSIFQGRPEPLDIAILAALMPLFRLNLTMKKLSVIEYY